MDVQNGCTKWMDKMDGQNGCTSWLHKMDVAGRHASAGRQPLIIRGWCCSHRLTPLKSPKHEVLGFMESNHWSVSRIFLWVILCQDFWYSFRFLSVSTTKRPQSKQYLSRLYDITWIWKPIIARTRTPSK